MSFLSHKAAYSRIAPGLYLWRSTAKAAEAKAALRWAARPSARPSGLASARGLWPSGPARH
eukprot:scaffold9905_cov117-Isochrysis_galbana.AAC.10